MFQRTLRQTTRQMGQNTIAVWIAARLRYLVITLKVIPLKKFLLVTHKILRLFVNTLIVDEKHYVLTIENLTQTIQIQLSPPPKKNIFSTFSCLFKIYIIFGTFAKKRWSWWLLYFRKNRLQKICLDKCLKSRVSEDP